jgi:hypothetical protein
MITVSSARVGDVIKRSIIAAVLVGHLNPRLTITDYIHPAVDASGEFLKDYMLIGENQLTLQAFVVNWSNIAQYLE